MFRSGPQSVAHYIRKKTAKELPASLCLELRQNLSETGSAVRSPEIEKINGTVNPGNSTSPSEQNSAAMDLFDSLLLVHINSPPDWMGLAKPTKAPSLGYAGAIADSAKPIFRQLRRVVVNLYCGLRIRLSKCMVWCSELHRNRFQDRAPKAQGPVIVDPASNPVVDKKRPDQRKIAPFHLKAQPVSLRRIGFALIVLILAGSGIGYWKSISLRSVEVAKQIKDTGEVVEKSVDMAMFEPSHVPNAVGGPTPENGSGIEYSASALSSEPPTGPEAGSADETGNREALNLGSSGLQSGATQWTEKASYLDQVADAYREVLQIDAQDSVAKQGLDKIGEKYAQWIRTIWETGETQLSLNLIERGLQHVPGHPGLLALRTEFGEQGEGRGAQEEKTETINLLLAKADKDVIAGRFVLPAGNNAVAKYREVLRLDPANPVASKGLERMVKVFEKAAREAQASGKPADCLQLIQQGLMIRPGYSELLAIRSSCNQGLGGGEAAATSLSVSEQI